MRPPPNALVESVVARCGAREDPIGLPTVLNLVAVIGVDVQLWCHTTFGDECVSVVTDLT